MKKTTLVISCLLAAAVEPVSAQLQTVTIPAGTGISIRTTSAINSKKADKSTDYPVSMDDPVTVDGVVVVPANANAWLRVTEVNNPRVGRATMSTALVAVAGATGERVDVMTGNVDSKAGSHAKRTLAGAGLGAGAGAAIGALGGGALGAGIGAAAGAASGAAIGGLTGAGVTIPSETRYTYRLSQPVTISYQVAPPVQTQAAPPQPPVGAPGPAPQGNVSIQLGQTPDQVTSMLGQPERKAVVGAKEIYFYKDMKVTFQNGAVSDVE